MESLVNQTNKRLTKTLHFFYTNVCYKNAAFAQPDTAHGFASE